MSEHEPARKIRRADPNDIAYRIQEMLNKANSLNLADEELDVLQKALQEITDMRQRIGDASILLADWDGYYDPIKQKGNSKELASVIEDAFTILQGRSWRSVEPQNEA